MLHALKRSSADKATLRVAIQKLIHAYPTDTWTLAMLVSLLDQTQDIKTKYRQLVMLHSEHHMFVLKYYYFVGHCPATRVFYWKIAGYQKGCG